MSYPFGRIFAEEIVKGKKRNIRKFDPYGVKTQTGRFIFIAFFFVLALGFLLARLFSLTIIQGERYFQLSSKNRIREMKITAPRGIIFDRNGIPLVRNMPFFTLPDGTTVYETLATASADVAEGIARDYIFGADLLHVLGFIGEASEEEIRNPKREPSGRIRNPKLELGDFTGKMGIEKAYNDLLRGVNGRTLLEVDAAGKQVRSLGNADPVPGRSLNLSVDSSLQTIAREELAGKKGAVVAADPKTGQILALYSSPSFDPNKLVRNEDIDALFSGSDQPFFNRAISGLYPPGSTFKIITSIAALESGAVNKNTKIEDVGILQVGQFSFGNWYFSQYGKKEGMVDIVTALKRSNDIFFYKTGEATGIETLAAWGKKVGLGNTLGIDIEGEAAGVMPDPAWRQKVRGEDWYLGDTYHVAIGQGDLQTTPLQVNAWTNVIAAGGRLCRPHLLLSDLSHLSNLLVLPAGGCKDLGIKKETISLIKEGMKLACSPGGTGWPLFEFRIQNSELRIDNLDFFPTFESTTSGKPLVKIPVACKTGTAEFNDPKNRTHAWFTVFAPIENPQISVTVLVEGGGEGSSVAAPIAKKILEKWFGQN